MKERTRRGPTDLGHAFFHAISPIQAARLVGVRKEARDSLGKEKEEATFCIIPNKPIGFSKTKKKRNLTERHGLVRLVPCLTAPGVRCQSCEGKDWKKQYECF
jgi:hypothetical protein